MELAVHHMVTQKQWGDIVLNPSTLEQVEQLRFWLKQFQQISRANNRLKAGYRALFYGPPGTGKSLAATILANEAAAEIYRIDLSRLVSQYIGETEKKLNALFQRAEEKGWILYFDEADALFGKRSEVKDAHDRYANPEVAYLLQRIEDYEGLVILATTRKNNIDVAFTRRFQSIIHFPLPTASERKRIWETGFLENKLILEKVDIDGIAEQYELSPAAIMNVIHYVKDTGSSNSVPITGKQVIEGITHGAV